MCCFLPTSWYLFHILTRPEICIDHSPARCQVTSWTLGQCKSAYWHCDFGRSASVCNGPGSDSLADVKSPTWCGYYSSHLQREKAFRAECKGFLHLFDLNIRKWKGDRNFHLIPQCNNTWPEMQLAQTKHWITRPCSWYSSYCMKIICVRQSQWRGVFNLGHPLKVSSSTGIQDLEYEYSAFSKCHMHWRYLGIRNHPHLASLAFPQMCSSKKCNMSFSSQKKKSQCSLCRALCTYWCSSQHWETMLGSHPFTKSTPESNSAQAFFCYPSNNWGLFTF